MESEYVRQEVYQIVVKGHLDSEWSDWFDGLTITLVDNGETILSGPVVDQSALHGVLIKIRDLGLPLLGLARIQQQVLDDTRGLVDLPLDRGQPSPRLRRELWILLQELHVAGQRGQRRADLVRDRRGELADRR